MTPILTEILLDSRCCNRATVTTEIGTQLGDAVIIEGSELVDRRFDRAQHAEIDQFPFESFCRQIGKLLGDTDLNAALRSEVHDAATGALIPCDRGLRENGQATRDRVIEDTDVRSAVHCDDQERWLPALDELIERSEITPARFRRKRLALRPIAGEKTCNLDAIGQRTQDRAINALNSVAGPDDTHLDPLVT